MVKYPLKISKETRVLLRPPEKEGEWFFSLPVINILNRHMKLSCIISEGATIPFDVLKCEEILRYEKGIKFLSRKYFRLKRMLSQKKFDIFVDMNESPLPIIAGIVHSDISISYKDAKRFNIHLKHSEGIDYLKKFFLIPNLMGISDKRMVWGMKNRFKWSEKDEKSIGYYFARERLKKKVRSRTDMIEIHSVKELSLLSLFVTDMNNFLPYAYIGNVPILYVRTPETLELPEREGVKTIAEKEFRVELRKNLKI